MWHDPNCMIKRDSLLLEHHNIRQEVVKKSKEILQQRQDETTRVDSDIHSGPGQSSNSRHTLEEITATERTMWYLSQEEQTVTGQDQEEDSDADTPTVTPKFDNPASNPEQAAATAEATQNITVHLPPPSTTNTAVLSPTPIQIAHPPFSDERLEADARIVKIIAMTGLNPYIDDNITSRPRENQDRDLPQHPRSIAPAQTILAMRESADARNAPLTNIGQTDKHQECSARELLNVVTMLRHKMDQVTDNLWIYWIQQLSCTTGRGRARQEPIQPGQTPKIWSVGLAKRWM